MIKSIKTEKICNGEELASKEEIENCVIEALKRQFPNCYVTCSYNMAYAGIDIGIEGFKNNKLCKLRRTFAMELFDKVLNAETSLTYILEFLTNDWMVIE